jgi:DNA-binding protein YbaB
VAAAWSVVDPADVEMLEDLILAAASEVQRRARERLEEEMKQATGGLPLPGLGDLLGG